jgi:hypothetical protein
MALSLRCHTRCLIVMTSAAAGAAGEDGSPMRGQHGDQPAGSLTERDRGGLSLMIVVLFVVLVALAGIVVDGGAKLAADENATALAQEAARAGATTVNVSTAYSTGSFVVDPARAVAAARQYLLGAGYRNFSVTTSGDKAITVRVTITERTKFLSLIGLRSFSATRTATAQLVTGVTGGT